MNFTVKLFCNDEDGQAEIQLPFPPFIGLMLRIPWRQMDYGEVEKVYWADDENRFEVFFKEGE